MTNIHLGHSEMSIPVVTQFRAFSLQVCVPTDWQDAQVVKFAEQRCRCGTDAGWQIRREGDQFLAGDPERVPCAERPGFVHVMLDA